MHQEKLPSKQPTVLFVDDDERILRTLNIQFRPLCRVLVTPDPQQAIAWATEQTIHVVVSDQRMPDMPGTKLLARMREVSPDTVRVLLTGYSDVDAAVGALLAALVGLRLDQRQHPELELMRVGLGVRDVLARRAARLVELPLRRQGPALLLAKAAVRGRGIGPLSRTVPARV